MQQVETVSSGIGLGTVIAVIISWITWHDVGWTIIHGLLGWLFVIWYFLFG
jgi:hypothetical protein